MVSRIQFFNSYKRIPLSNIVLLLQQKSGSQVAKLLIQHYKPKKVVSLYPQNL